MYLVCVSIHVKPDKIHAFLAATLDNAKNTRLEPGNVRFDVLQGEDDPARFLLYEAYHQKEDFAKHHQTEHYFRWRDTVADWMDQPRTVTKNMAVFFGDAAL